MVHTERAHHTTFNDENGRALVVQLSKHLQHELSFGQDTCFAYGLHLSNYRASLGVASFRFNLLKCTILQLQSKQPMKNNQQNRRNKQLNTRLSAVCVVVYICVPLVFFSSLCISFCICFHPKYRIRNTVFSALRVWRTRATKCSNTPTNKKKVHTKKHKRASNFSYASFIFQMEKKGSGMRRGASKRPRERERHSKRNKQNATQNKSNE